MVALAGAFALTVVACSPQETGPSPARGDPGVKGVRLYVFDCGTLQVDPARFRLATEEVATISRETPPAAWPRFFCGKWSALLWRVFSSPRHSRHPPASLRTKTVTGSPAAAADVGRDELES